MTNDELILYQNREKQRKDAEDEAIEAGKPRIKKVEESTGGNTNFMSPSVNGDTPLTATEHHISSGTHETTSSSVQSFEAKGSVLSTSTNIGPQVGQSSSSSGQITTIKSSGGVARVGGSSESKIPTINNFAIVKMTGSDNFGKSAYTIGSKASSRAIKTVDYIARDGAISKETKEIEDKKELEKTQIQNKDIETKAKDTIDYIGREGALLSENDSRYLPPAIYNEQGNKITIEESKEDMVGITGERRIVYSPDSRLNFSDKDFHRVISNTINNFSKDLQKDFQFGYQIHRNTENPHVHLNITTKSVSGEGVKMYKDELFEMKMRFYENTQELAEQKRDRYEIVYKDNSHQSLAMQIGKFTGDIPAGEFANQNIFLAQRIAEKYNLEFDQKEMEKNTDNIKKFFTDNKDQYNDFITNAKNRYADTFTKYSKDANDLATKYNLQEVPKDIEGFQKYLKVHEKLFLADKIAEGRGIQITNADLRNLTTEIRKDEKGKITKEGIKDLKASNEWFDRNKESVKEWNNENKNRISKELSNRFEQLNERVDINFDIPKNRIEGISLNNEYRQNKTIFANDTRKALIDILESRKFYFKGEYMKDNITKDEYKTNMERIDSLKENTKAYGSISEGALTKYKIDTNFLVKEKKTFELDGIKGESGENKENLEKLLSKALNKKNITDEQKDKIERVSATFAKEQKISLSALENIGFKREKLQADFKIEKIETVANIINFKETQKELDFQKEALYKSDKPTLEEWKEENTQNYEFVSQKRFEKIRESFQNTIKENENFKGKGEFVDKGIDSINSKLEKLSKNIIAGKQITKENFEAVGIRTKGIKTKIVEKDVEFISKSKANDLLVETLLKEDKYSGLVRKYQDNKLPSKYLETILLKDGFSPERIDSFAKDNRNISQEVVISPHNVKLSGETVSKAFFHKQHKVIDRLKNEHNIDIKSAKDLAANFDKIGTPSELRQNIIKEVQNKINEFRVTNNLNDNIDFFQYKEQLNFQKEQSREISSVIKAIKSNTPLEQTVLEKYDLSGDRRSDLEKLVQAKNEFALDTQQKELNSLNGLLEKNEKLQPLFDSDLKKIDAGGINFKDETLVNIKVDVIPNTTENNKLLSNSFSQMIENAQKELNSFDINSQDKEALTKIFKESKKNQVFKDNAREYLQNAVDITQSKTYVGLLAETKTLQSMQYLLNAGEEKGIDNVPKAFLEARNIDTSIFRIEKVDKPVPAIQMGSEVNLKAFQELKEESYSKTNEEVKVSLSDISAAISRSFTQSEPNHNQEERLEDWAILKSAPQEAINILKSFSEQAQEELKDANLSELKNINKDIEGYKAMIESLDKDKETVKTVQKEPVNKVDEVQKPIEEKYSHTSQKYETNKISQQEINELKTMTKEHLLYADPSNVLNALGIDYKVEKGGARYNFSIRAGDKTSSAFMYLGEGGTWRFKDFGSNQSGTIENVVMTATGMNYKDALNFSLEANGLKNLVSEAIDINKAQHQIELSQAHREKLEALKNANLEKSSKSDVHSRVVSYREITPKDTTVLNFLEARGIDGIPKDMFIIEGEVSGISAKTGQDYTYKNIGVGVLTGDMSKPIELDKVGADIHFLNPKTKADGTTMKTQSFGAKDITIIPGENTDGKNISVFESKMDYAAASVKLDLSETTAVIANGVGNAGKISDFIKETNPDNVTFFNQNDSAGEKFVENIVDKANIDKFDFIKYEEGEHKQDINDLVKNNIQLEDRLITNENIETFLEMSTLKSIEQLEVEALISKGDLQGAEQVLQNGVLDKDITEKLSQQIDLLKTLNQVNSLETKYEIEMKTNENKEIRDEEIKDRVALQEQALQEENYQTAEEIKVSLSDISSAISRSFTQSEPNLNKEERLEDWAILKSAPNEAINILKSFSEQAQEELKDANFSELKNINKDIEGYKVTIESLEKIKETINKADMKCETEVATTNENKEIRDEEIKEKAALQELSLQEENNQVTNEEVHEKQEHKEVEKPIEMGM